MSSDQGCLINFEAQLQPQSQAQTPPQAQPPSQPPQTANDLIIDYREHDLLANLKTFKPTVKNLQVGDINIGNKLIIERKTISDFEASFIDGRYRDQRSRLLVYCQEIGAQPLYIFEGDISKPCRLQSSAMNKLLLRLSIHYKIPIFQTNNTRHTAQIVEDWYSQWIADPSSFEIHQEQIRLADNIHVSKKTNATDPKQFLTACLCQISGVSVKIAEIILAHYQNLQKILEAKQEDLANLKQSSGRKIGPALAERIYQLLHQ
jgi:ERCC4-type nuclease